MSGEGYEIVDVVLGGRHFNQALMNQKNLDSARANCFVVANSCLPRQMTILEFSLRYVWSSGCASLGDREAVRQGLWDLANTNSQ